MSIADHRYLIVAGTTKSATTSMFTYLAPHPAICKSNAKETRFFLDVDYPVRAIRRWNEEGMEGYNAFFEACRPDAIRMEATPDYLYSAGTAARIAEALPDVRLIFLLRDPVERFLSWHRFAVQNGSVPKDMSLEDFLAAQADPPTPDTPQHFRALAQGRYAGFLAPFLSVFGKDRVRIFFMEDLARDPRSIMRNICDFAGLQADVYDTYEFSVQNRTAVLRYPMLHRLYNAARHPIPYITRGRPRLQRFVHALRLRLEPIYLRLNRGRDEAAPMRAETLAKLRAYYREEPAALVALSGQQPPWPAVAG